MEVVKPVLLVTVILACGFITNLPQVYMYINLAQPECLSITTFKIICNLQNFKKSFPAQLR